MVDMLRLLSLVLGDGDNLYLCILLFWVVADGPDLEEGICLVLRSKLLIFETANQLT